MAPKNKPALKIAPKRINWNIVNDHSRKRIAFKRVTYIPSLPSKKSIKPSIANEVY